MWQLFYDSVYNQTCPCGQNYRISKFRVLDFGRSDFECKIKEALYIKRELPKLNGQLSQSGISFLLSVF